MRVEARVRHSAFSVYQKRWIIFLAAFAGWFSTLSSFIFFPAIPVVSSSLGASIEEINLTVTSYLIVSAIAPSVVGGLSDSIGRRPVYLAVLGIYCLSNIGLAIQSSFPAIFALRMIQSAGVSGMLLSSLRVLHANTCCICSMIREGLSLLRMARLQTSL